MADITNATKGQKDNGKAKAIEKKEETNDVVFAGQHFSFNIDLQVSTFKNMLYVLTSFNQH